jgi:hypothetical protein
MWTDWIGVEGDMSGHDREHAILVCSCHGCCSLDNQCVLEIRGFVVVLVSVRLHALLVFPEVPSKRL